MIDKEELKFKLKEKTYELKVMFYYFLKEPFIEIKRILEGYYNSVLLFWVSLATGVYFWVNGFGGWRMKIIIVLIIFSYIYSFSKSGRWKEYYKKEYIEGKELE